MKTNFKMPAVAVQVKVTKKASTVMVKDPKALPRIDGREVRLYSSEGMMNAVQIAEYMTKAIQEEIIGYVLDEHHGLSYLFNHRSWHNDEGRGYDRIGQLGVCTYEKAIKIINKRKIRYCICTYVRLFVHQQQLNDPKIRELVLSGPFKVYVSNGNSYKELPDSPLPYMHKGHVEKFIGGAK